jgi:hypothetical protein
MQNKFCALHPMFEFFEAASRLQISHYAHIAGATTGIDHKVI